MGSKGKNNMYSLYSFNSTICFLPMLYKCTHRKGKLSKGSTSAPVLSGAFSVHSNDVELRLQGHNKDTGFRQCRLTLGMEGQRENCRAQHWLPRSQRCIIAWTANIIHNVQWLLMASVWPHHTHHTLHFKSTWTERPLRQNCRKEQGLVLFEAKFTEVRSLICGQYWAYTKVQNKCL